jgi:hypothetical protein
MILIDTINYQPRQQLTIDFQGKNIIIQLAYFVNLQKWFINLQYNDQTYNGITLTLNSNVISALNKILPFGIACLPVNKNDTIDPCYCDVTNQDNDFVRDRVRLYIVPTNEMATLQSTLETLYSI